ncbi:serine threonine kinase [Apiospora phragmitis]|uniref:Serine threonine kinase n=1 Tax=Apiospora phragmitis TaxID=2905665 RepID=A0ABR1VYN5_9PEZI
MLAYIIGDGAQGVAKMRDHFQISRRHVDRLYERKSDVDARINLDVLGWVAEANNSVIAQRLKPLWSKMFAEASLRITAKNTCIELIDMELARVTYHDGIREVTFKPASSLRPLTTEERLRRNLELWLGQKIDWWPLSPLPPKSSPNDVIMEWECDSHHLSVVLSKEQAKLYKSVFSPLQASSPSRELGRSSFEDRGDYYAIQMDPIAGDIGNRSLIPTSDFGDRDQNSSSSSQSSGSRESSRSRQSSVADKKRTIFYCVDVPYSEPKRTLLYSVEDVDALEDDRMFYARAHQGIRASKGTGLTRWVIHLLYWKACTRVEFIQFHIVADGKDEVLRGETGLPPVANLGYQRLVRVLNAVQFKCIAEQIVHGLANPSSARDKRTVIQMVPKKLTPPPFERRMGEEGWGIDIKVAFSVTKIPIWLSSRTLLTLGFVTAWLSLIKSTDLTNAFVPTSFLVGIVTVASIAIQTLAT